MSETESEALDVRVARLQAELDALTKDKKAPWYKRVAAGLGAALTTPEAVNAEKSLLTVVVTRLVLYAPAVAVYVDLLLKAFGAPSVSP